MLRKSNELDRRQFLIGVAATTLSVSATGTIAAQTLATGNIQSPSRTHQNSIFVSVDGDDGNVGSPMAPLRSFQGAQRLVRRRKQSAFGSINVYFRSGTYYLPEQVVFTPVDSGEPETPVTYTSYPGESAVISGGTPLRLEWTSYRGGIMKARVPPGTRTDQLFVNGERQILARYPNYDPHADRLNGWAEDAISKRRASRWRDPRGGYVHGLNQPLWGSMHYRITGRNAEGEPLLEGGWQINQAGQLHDKYRFVENIFEELDAPGEWFLNEQTSTLYYYPPKGLDLQHAVVEIVRLKHLVEFRGTPDNPVKAIELCGLTFRHSLRTFMETREPLLRSDWRIYRGGAVFLNGTEDCRLSGCFLDQMGGNAIFASGYNRRLVIATCHIARSGASGVCFVGNPAAVRSAVFDFDTQRTLADIDTTPGPRSNQYPMDCTVEDTLIYQTGRVEKQSAPVEISMAQSISVRNCSIYEVPRAGINIGDGTWGGHLIDGCDVFDTVRETSDHGAFNSWGRDRWWRLKGVDLDSAIAGPEKSLPVLDAIRPNILSNSRWRCDHGWDIDLDDGSSNYQIRNNLCLNGGIKLREGFYRICENNVLVNNTLHPHVWFKDSKDIFRNNIVFAAYKPIQVRGWGEDVDFNFLQEPGAKQVTPARELQQLSDQDEHSLCGDACFRNPAVGDYQVQPDSSAMKVGFMNFAMDKFGVQSPYLRSIARQPELPRPKSATPMTLRETRSRTAVLWEGAIVRNIVGIGEVSAMGAPGEAGVVVMNVPTGSPAAKAGFAEGDLILMFDKENVDTVNDLLSDTARLQNGRSAVVTALRNYQRIQINIVKLANTAS